MSTLISGILKNANGQPMPNVGITLTSLRTNRETIISTETALHTLADGSYSFDIAVGTYSVSIGLNSTCQVAVGQIRVLMDSVPGTLEEFLTIPGVDEVTPEILAQVIQARYDAINAAQNAANDATSIINQQLSDQEDRFNQFILSSGYTFLGDYENGPFQFSARNQYVRYDGQYYRLNAITDVGFTTTGTTGTTFANDVTHFVLMDGDTLRQNLGSDDGQKLIGKCATLDALRTTEPEYHGQEIVLFRAVADGPVLNERLYYDATDTISEENGYSVFVTTNGARWKADISRGVNVFLAGYSDSENNLVECLNKICEDVVASAVSTRQINDRKLTVFVPWRESRDLPLSIDFLLNSDGTARVERGKFNYVWDGQVKLPPSLIHLHFEGSPLLACVQHGVVPLKVCHEFTGLTTGLGNNKNGYSHDAGGQAVTSDGYVTFMGDVIIQRDPDTDLFIETNAEGSDVGMIVGNTAAGYLSVRDVLIDGIHLGGFKAGFSWGTYNTYANIISNVRIFNCLYGRYQGAATVNDSGEGLRFRDSFLSNVSRSAFYTNCSLEAYDSAMHLDYAGTHAVEVGPLGNGNLVLDGSSWIEGDHDQIVTRPQTGNISQFRFQMNGGKIVPNRYKVNYRGVRPIFSCPQYASLIVELNDVDLNGAFAGYMCDDAYGSWSKPGDNTVVIARYRYSDTYKWLPSWKYGNGGYLINPLYSFSGASGVSLPTSKATADAASAYFFAIKPAGAQVVYGDPILLDGVSHVPVNITLANSTDIAYLFLAKNIKFPRDTVKLSTKISVRCGDAVGNVTVRAANRALGNPNLAISGTTVTQSDNLLSTILGESVDVKNTILTKSYITKTKDDFISTPPLYVDNFYKGSIESNCGWMITGYTGTVQFILPALWFDCIHPNV